MFRKKQQFISFVNQQHNRKTYTIVKRQQKTFALLVKSTACRYPPATKFTKAKSSSKTEKALTGKRIDQVMLAFEEEEEGREVGDSRGLHDRH